MAQALDPSAYIHQGFWTNWSKPYGQGLTLTLSPIWATLLTNSLALFVTMSGGQLWTIIRFTLHQMRACDKAGNTNFLYNQEQVVLRNAGTAPATAKMLMGLAWSSRSINRTGPSTIPIIIFAVASAVFFTVAGTFSNQVASAGQTVLSRSAHCGPWNQTYLDLAGTGVNAASEETFALSIEFIAKVTHDVQLSLEYANECYKMNLASYSPSSCSILQQPRIPWDMSNNNLCPFNSATCSKKATTVVLDTGPIDSHEDLGINAPVHERVTYRRVLNCTVLENSGYTTDFISLSNSTASQHSFDVAYAYYGRSLVEGTDWTYSFSDYADFFTNFTGQSTPIPYQVDSQIAFAPSSFADASTFVPIPGLQKEYADVALFLLSFNGRYLGPVDDPWFAAHEEQESTNHLAAFKGAFTRDRPISTLGCTEQHQICLPSENCTPLLGFNQIQEEIRQNLNPTPHQNVTVDRVLRAAIASRLDKVVEDLQLVGAPLAAINYTATGSETLSLPPPDHQWQLELQNWNNISLAHFQRQIVEYGTGQIAPQPQFLLRPQNESEAWICQNLRIKSTVYQSFSVVVIAMITVLGALVVTLSLTIELLASRVQKRINRGANGRQIWDDHDMLGPQFWRQRFDRYHTTSSSSSLASREKNSCPNRQKSPDVLSESTIQRGRPLLQEPFPKSSGGLEGKDRVLYCAHTRPPQLRSGVRGLFHSSQKQLLVGPKEARKQHFSTHLNRDAQYSYHAAQISYFAKTRAQVSTNGMAAHHTSSPLHTPVHINTLDTPVSIKQQRAPSITEDEGFWI